MHIDESRYFFFIIKLLFAIPLSIYYTPFLQFTLLKIQKNRCYNLQFYFPTPKIAKEL